MRSLESGSQTLAFLFIYLFILFFFFFGGGGGEVGVVDIFLTILIKNGYKRSKHEVNNGSLYKGDMIISSV